MGRTAKVFFVGIMVLSSSVFIRPALAATSGNDLLRFCTSVPDSTEQSFCLGYLHGVVDGSMAVRISEGRPPIFALPAGADILQIRDVVVKFLKENPKDRHLEAVVLVFKALTAAYPPNS